MRIVPTEMELILEHTQQGISHDFSNVVWYITRERAGKTTSRNVQDVIKEDHALKKKVLEAAEAYTNNSTNITELLSLVKNFDSLGFKSIIESLQAVATIQSDIASLKTDTSEIKAMMIEIFYAFKGRSFSTPSSSVPKPTLAITKGEKDDMITKETVSKTANVEKEPAQEPRDTESIIITIDPDAQVLIPFKINGKLCHLTNKEIQAHIEHEERKERVAQEARLLALSKPELIKVVTEVATKVGVDPKALQSSKGSKEFIKK
nr:hypothetical protein [Tanacetum cinerariifolium]